MYRDLAIVNFSTSEMFWETPRRQKFFSVIHPFILYIVSLKATRDKWRFRLCLRGVQFVSVVCCTQRRLSLRCAPLRRDCLHGVMHPKRFFLNLELFTSNRLHNGDRLCGVLQTVGCIYSAEIVSTVCCTPRIQFCDQISRRNRNQVR